MKKRIISKRSFYGAGLVSIILLLFTCAVVLADTIETKDGKIINGKYMGGTQNSVRFQTDKEVKTFPISEILAITFTSSALPAPHTTPAEETVAPAKSVASDIKGPITIPAGTVLMVSTTDQVSSNDASGRRFSAKLAADLTSNGVTAATSGTTVFGRVAKSAQAGRLVGRSELELNLTEINIDGKMYPLMTTNFAEAGKGSFRKTARNVGLGALMGGAFGDSDDAKKGAAIGAGLSVIRKGKSVVVPAGAILEFRMTQPLTIMK
jgi:hypothetical protein